MNEIRIAQLPAGGCDVVLDTDTFNEIDDQFALAYLLKHEPEFRVRAICAAPFFNRHSESPADGMEKSYHEILHLLRLMDHPSDGLVFRGSDRFLTDEKTPVVSDAARRLVELSREYSAEYPLYVVAIGAITNVASAYLLDPTLADRIVLVWLGGHALHWEKNDEFNLKGDLAAARVIFGSRIPLVQLPCMGVVSAFTVSDADLTTYLKGKNALCDYLVEHTFDEVRRYTEPPFSRVIWDVTAVAWLFGEFLSDRVIDAPIPTYDCGWETPETPRPIRYVYHVNRDRLWKDMVRRLTE